MSESFQPAQSASVTSPDSLQVRVGWAAARARSCAAQGSRVPAFMSGLAMWSRTNGCWGKRWHSSMAAGSWRG